MKKDSKIYVAGHRGLVGSAILRKLEKEGYTNLIVRTSTELDLRDKQQVDVFFELEKPEFVFLFQVLKLVRSFTSKQLIT
ncbi:NAD dependent epimerase/dehydratase family [Exiguobacterium antarcticum B7]|nr:NAD dependent epimerase/dehydratase family [Exiguobacterium antarcticum B7]